MSHQRLDATIVINTYEQALTLDLALHALAEQDFTGAWEIVVVDDGSTDLTRDVVTKWSAQTDISILYVRMPKRGMRWSRARNIGLRLGEGVIFVFFDADMIPDRETVRLHVEEHRRSPCLLAGSRLWRNADVDLPNGSTVAEQLRHLRNQTESLDPTCRTREVFEGRLRDELLSSSFPWRAWFGCHVSFPAMADALYDESMLGWGPSDIELGCRLYHDRALPVRFLSKARAWHVEREGSNHNPFRTADSMAVTEYVRQVCYMIFKHQDLDLMSVIDLGFDRIVLDSQDRWHTVPRGQGGDKRRTLEIALQWYARTAVDPNG